MSVRRKIYLIIFKKALSLLAFAAVFTVLYIYYQSTLEKAQHGIWAIPVLAAIFVAIVLKTKIINLICDRDWEGEVQSVSSKIGYEPITLFSALGRRVPRQIPYTIVKVKKDNGKTVKFKFQSQHMAPSLFKVGGKIKHLKGTVFPLILTEDKSVDICPMCGRWLKQRKCPDCKINF